jgi:hypothetical protein
VGSVTNHTSQTLSYVEVDFNTLISGDQFGNIMANANNLGPGMTGILQHHVKILSIVSSLQELRNN